MLMLSTRRSIVTRSAQAAILAYSHPPPIQRPETLRVAQHSAGQAADLCVARPRASRPTKYRRVIDPSGCGSILAIFALQGQFSERKDGEGRRGATSLAERTVMRRVADQTGTTAA